MECRFMGFGRPLLRRSANLLSPPCLHVRKTPFLSLSHSPARNYVSSSTRRTASHADASAHDTTTAAVDGSDSRQAYPLSGYYSDILSRSPYRRQATTTRPVPKVPKEKAADKPTPATTVEPQTPQEKMAIVFGTRLAGPGRQSRYNPGDAPESTWKTVNGVPIPPRPEEPDNCCMSGCVHCVWDDFRDEIEEWAARLAQAKAKGSTPGAAGEMRHAPRPEVASASVSMDDDGGGSDTNWSVPDQSEDLFAGIPVGIREFMKTEKKLKLKHQEEAAS